MVKFNIGDELKQPLELFHLPNILSRDTGTNPPDEPRTDGGHSEKLGALSKLTAIDKPRAP